MPAAGFAEVRHLPQLSAAIRPLSAPCQLIHGDLSGNVLFHGQLPPAIIDFTPYWRPAGYASAIVVADALVWEGADRGILAAVSDLDDFGQYLVRALVFRELTDWICNHDQPPAAEAEPPAAEAGDARSRGGRCPLGASGRPRVPARRPGLVFLLLAASPRPCGRLVAA